MPSLVNWQLRCSPCVIENKLDNVVVCDNVIDTCGSSSLIPGGCFSGGGGRAAGERAMRAAVGADVATTVAPGCRAL